MLSQIDIERERYEARRRAQLDYTSGLNSARRQGRMLGEIIGTIHTCEEMPQRPVTPEEQLLALSLEDLKRRAEDLKRQAMDRH